MIIPPTFRLAAIAGLLLVSGEAAGQDPGPPTRVDGRMSAEARLQMQQRFHPGRSTTTVPDRPLGRSTTPVPPELEIEILDPNVDPLGNPAVIPRPAGDGTGLAIDIPPVALVHRYYYSGDRSFQGPMLPGGPSILVMNHPRTNERIYLDVMMLPGAPRVIYRRHSIEYDYGPQAITIGFGLHGRPSVTYRNGVPLLVRARRASARVGESAGQLVERSGLPTVTQKLGSGAKNVAATSVDRAHDLGKAVAAPVIGIVRATPLSTVLTSSPEDRAKHLRDSAVSRAGAATRDLDATIATVR